MTEQTPTRLFYDIEVINNHYTIAICDLSRKVVTIALHHHEDAQNMYDYKQLREGLKADYPDYRINPIYDMRNNDFTQYFMRAFINHKDNTEWLGWNSKNYDLMIQSAIFGFYDIYKMMPNPQTIRQWSDLIIVEGYRYDSLFFPQLASHANDTLSKIARTYYKKAVASLKHVDVGALNEKSTDDTSKSFFPFPLKVIQSYVGLDVIDDDIVKGDGSFDQATVDEGLATAQDGFLTQAGLKQLLSYNINDVISTGRIFEEDEYIGSLSVRDELRNEFSFLTKQPNEPSYLYQLPRDATSSQYASKIIRGKDNLKINDMPKVSYQFPFPNGKWYNLLDVIEAREPNINPRVIEFYRHVEGRSLKTKDDSYFIKESSPTGKTTINVPYMDKNGNATSAYITPSWGGSHGGIVKGSYGRRLDRPEDKAWFRYFETASVSDLAVTVDLKNVIAVDFDSYYPTLNIRLGVYKQKGHLDNYKMTYETRMELKSLKKQYFQVDDEMYKRTDERQNSYKLVLNSATGASNQQKEHADLPLDNATMSMRIIGNLLIYTLGQRLADKGGLIISTNTDGIFVANLTMDEVQEVVDLFEKNYGMGLEPEFVNRMINKSANERIEYNDDNDISIGGALGRSLGNRIDLSSRLNYPRASGKAVIRYMLDNDMWLHEPISVEKLRHYLVEQLASFKPIDWVITLKGNRDRQFYIEDLDDYAISDFNQSQTMFDTQLKPLQNTNRIIMTRHGHRIIQKMKGSIEKITGLTSNIGTILNRQSELEDTSAYIDDIDIHAYLQWAVNLLKTWHNADVVPEIDHKEVEINKQLSIDDLYV